MLLLLTEPGRCPRCHMDTVSKDSRSCTSCHAKLIFSGDTAVWLHEQGLRDYYLFTKEQGWIHSDHLSGNTTPNERFPKFKDPGPSYGRKPLPKGCSAE